MPALARRRFRDLRFLRDRRLSGRDQARAEPDPDRATARGRGRSGMTSSWTRSCSPAAARCSSTASSRRDSWARRATRRSADKAECEELPPLLDYLESVIPESGFLVEDRLTLADIAVASPFVNFRHLQRRDRSRRLAEGHPLCGGDPRPAELRAADRARERLSWSGSRPEARPALRLAGRRFAAKARRCSARSITGRSGSPATAMRCATWRASRSRNPPSSRSRRT